MDTNYIKAITDALWKKIENQQENHGMALLTKNAMPYNAYGHASDPGCKLADPEYCKRVWALMSLPKGHKADFEFAYNPDNRDETYEHNFYPICDNDKLMGVLIHQTARDEHAWSGHMELDMTATIMAAILKA